MGWKKGQSGNQKGRPQGAKGKATFLRDALEARGLDAASLALGVYDAAMSAGDLGTAAKVAIEFLRLTYTPPALEAEPEPPRVNLTLADFFPSRPAPEIADS